MSSLVPKAGQPFLRSLSVILWVHSLLDGPSKVLLQCSSWRNHHGSLWLGSTPSIFSSLHSNCMLALRPLTPLVRKDAEDAHQMVWKAQRNAQRRLMEPKLQVSCCYWRSWEAATSLPPSPHIRVLIGTELNSGGGNGSPDLCISLLIKGQMFLYY